MQIIYTLDPDDNGPMVHAFLDHRDGKQTEVGHLYFWEKKLDDTYMEPGFEPVIEQTMHELAREALAA